MRIILFTSIEYLRFNIYHFRKYKLNIKMKTVFFVCFKICDYIFSWNVWQSTPSMQLIVTFS